MKIARVFPRKTKASPTDELAFFSPPGLFPPEVDEVHISVAFTWDLRIAEYLADSWCSVAPIKMGGPAMDMRSEDFKPGMYLKPGYVITSRGCPNSCWFCSVWRREGQAVRELPITEGWNVQDDNLLACSENHIRAVFEMLKRQKRRAQFTGGLEAAILADWHVDLLVDLKPEQIFFAYNFEKDYEPLVEAGRKLFKAGFNPKSHDLRAYVLIGYPEDKLSLAENRLEKTLAAGFTPMAMLWMNSKGNHKSKGLDGKDIDWKRLQRKWARPAAIYAKNIRRKP